MRRLLTMVLVASITLFGCRGGSEDPPAGSSEQTGASIALGSSAGAGCVEPYPPATLVTRAFAFDGTVTHISIPDQRSSGDEIFYAAVTFEVQEWFRAGAPDRVEIQMDSLLRNSLTGAVDYHTGSRLLIT